jgi:hypothetical protein
MPPRGTRSACQRLPFLTKRLRLLHGSMGLSPTRRSSKSLASTLDSRRADSRKQGCRASPNPHAAVVLMNVNTPRAADASPLRSHVGSRRAA